MRKKFNIASLAVCLVALALITSCRKMDDYKQYIKGGEISYTGKIDSVKILSGRNRVLVRGLFLADPKVTSLRIFWNNFKDSVTIPVTRKNTVDSLAYFVEKVEEGVQNFVLFTYDKDGNKSIPVYRTGKSYGDRYQSSLQNRGISAALTGSDGKTTINWLGMDRLTGVFATEVEYTNTGGKTVKVRTPIDSTVTRIADFKPSSNIRYRTLFLPDTIAIDTFSTDYATRYVPQFVQQDVTRLYLKNAGPNVNRAAYDGGRWGTLADWTSNAGAKNISNGLYGGYEYRNKVGVISFEAGWGLPALNNGLIYQTINLPAGTYSFQLSDIDQNSGGSRFIVVAEGNTLPDVSKVGSAIASSEISSGRLDFTLTAPKTVSIGFAVTIDASGQYIKIGSVRLYKQSYQ